MVGYVLRFPTTVVCVNVLSAVAVLLFYMLLTKVEYTKNSVFTTLEITNLIVVKVNLCRTTIHVLTQVTVLAKSTNIEVNNVQTLRYFDAISINL